MITSVGERALRVQFGEEISPSINDCVLALADALQRAALPGVLGWSPAYAVLTIHYDPLCLSYDDLRLWVEQALAQVQQGLSFAGREVSIPVHYGGMDGPDLDFVAQHTGLSPAEVIARHSAVVYRVYMLGFLPGFAYLGGLDPALHTPRLQTPRLQVPAGSVGIAGAQTGVYPCASPGGWRLIGRTDLRLYEAEADPPCLLAPGDRVRFVAV
jgi:KipI family sensor histidine kinase inhibitor